MDSNRSHTASSYVQASEADAPPARRTCAHEDQRLLWDLECCFRTAVRDSVRPSSAATPPSNALANAVLTRSPRPSGLLSSARSPADSARNRSSTQSPYQRTAASAVSLAPGCNTGLSTWQQHSGHTGWPSEHGRESPRERLVRARKIAQSPGEDLTRQLRMMFCREVKRKQRKTSVLPKVAEVPREGSLQLDAHFNDHFTIHEESLGAFSFSM